MERRPDERRRAKRQGLASGLFLAAADSETNSQPQPLTTSSPSLLGGDSYDRDAYADKNNNNNNAGRPAFDLSGNFAAPSRDWRARVLTPLTSPRVNYTVVAAGTRISSIRWVGGRDAWFSGANETTIDRLGVGQGGHGRGDVEESGDGGPGPGRHAPEGSASTWLSKGQGAITGNNFITIQVQAWLQGASGNTVASEGGSSSSEGSYMPQPGDYMKLKIGWTRQEGSVLRRGVSTSGLFTVAESVDAPTVRQKWTPEIVQSFDKALADGGEIPQEKSSPQPGLPFGTAVATSTGSPAPGIATDPSPSPDQSQGGEPPSPSSISTGAIAGIATGCGIALMLLVTALVWYLVGRRRRRRQQQQQQQPPGKQGQDRDKAAALADDSRNSTAQAACSPPSPYPVDNHGRGPPPVGRQERTEAANRVAGAIFAQQGMTAEERRRWEEEERQLDDDIARINGLF